MRRIRKALPKLNYCKVPLITLWHSSAVFVILCVCAFMHVVYMCIMWFDYMPVLL